MHLSDVLALLINIYTFAVDFCTSLFLVHNISLYHTSLLLENTCDVINLYSLNSIIMTVVCTSILYVNSCYWQLHRVFIYYGELTACIWPRKLYDLFTACVWYGLPCVRSCVPACDSTNSGHVCPPFSGLAPVTPSD